jgi:glycine hydroxymethyltransferase
MILARGVYGKELDSGICPRIQGGPLMHIIAGKAVCFGEALKPEFRAYAQQVMDNAKALADTLLSGGLRLVSGGTDNHLMLVDVTALGLGGKKAEHVLDACGITVNKNMIPYDQRKPVDPSGIRVGTPALTTRGMKVAEMKSIGRWMLQALKAPDDAGVHETIRGQVRDLCADFPAPAAAMEAADV